MRVVIFDCTLLLSFTNIMYLRQFSFFYQEVVHFHLSMKNVIHTNEKLIIDNKIKSLGHRHSLTKGA